MFNGQQVMTMYNNSNQMMVHDEDEEGNMVDTDENESANCFGQMTTVTQQSNKSSSD
jgi:hypothetical protein